jgi:hypothetical protein
MFLNCPQVKKILTNSKCAVKRGITLCSLEIQIQIQIIYWSQALQRFKNTEGGHARAVLRVLEARA